MEPRAIDKSLAKTISIAGIAYYCGPTKNWQAAKRALTLQLNHVSPRTAKYIRALLVDDKVGEQMFVQILDQWEHDSKQASITPQNGDQNGRA